jgi:small-conductance mechanosensitive channel
MEINYFLAVIWLAGFSIVFGKILAPIFLGIVGRITSRTKSTLDDRILKDVKGPAASFFFLFLFYALVHTIPFYESAIPVVEQYTSVAVILVVTYLLFKMVKAVFHWYFEVGHKSSHVKVELSLLPLLQKGSQIVIMAVGLMLVLSELGFQIAGLLAFTSLIAVVLGLASQETLANLFAGLALQLDRIYHYGDYLRLPTGEVARVRKIGMRSSKLYDLSGKMILVSNSELAKMRVTKVGTPGKLVLNIPFEAPLNIPAHKILEHVKAGLSREQPESLHDTETISVAVLKVKAPGWYDGVIKVHSKETQDYTPLIDLVNDLIIQAVLKEGMGGFTE